MSRPIILLVDDDPAVRYSIAFALGIEGFDVTAFESAETMLASEIEGPRACIVLDQRLPGMDGLSLLDRLRNNGERAPAIIITSNPTQRFRQRVSEAGAQLVEKPLLRDELALAVQKIVSGAEIVP
jgi:FixJ family two-component response regulator